ncbi:MAG: chemotaxis protein CheW [Deltaproteobacteria bacterium]|nr:chemotaxis protein CheW [Deltaproteobacteria bacterium]
MEILHVTEIIGVQPCTEVPDVPAFVKGVINLRGQVIPVMDMRLRLGRPEREPDDRTCIVVVSLGEVRVGLVVDRVAEVRDIPPENISPAPSVGRGSASRFIRAMGRVDDSVKILLDVPRLLNIRE